MTSSIGGGTNSMVRGAQVVKRSNYAFELFLPDDRALRPARVRETRFERRCDLRKNIVVVRRAVARHTFPIQAFRRGVGVLELRRFLEPVLRALPIFAIRIRVAEVQIE